MAINTPGVKKRKFIFSSLFAGWWCMWTGLHFAALTSFGIAPAEALTDGIVSYSLLAALCLMVNNNMRYYLPRREKYWYVLVLSFALSSLWLLVMRVILWSLYKHDAVYMHSLSQTASIRYAIAFLMMAAVTMLSLLWYTQKNQQEDNSRLLYTERLAREAELNKLRQQLQPHFLFNSLNSISALTGTQPEKARYMIEQLADFLRGTLKKEAEQSTTLEEELQYLRLYLDIEKVRFGYRLQTNIVCEEAILQLKLPPMLLQPVVENAIKFGLYDTLGEVVIVIAAADNNGMLQVSVQNPFDEATAAQIKGTGFGLSSIRRRLFLLFGRHDLLTVKKENAQFITQITIPQTV